MSSVLIEIIKLNSITLKIVQIEYILNCKNIELEPRSKTGSILQDCILLSDQIKSTMRGYELKFATTVNQNEFIILTNTYVRPQGWF